MFRHLSTYYHQDKVLILTCIANEDSRRHEYEEKEETARRRNQENLKEKTKTKQGFVHKKTRTSKNENVSDDESLDENKNRLLFCQGQNESLKNPVVRVMMSLLSNRQNRLRVQKNQAGNLLVKQG
jgi:hypothetical protein